MSDQPVRRVMALLGRRTEPPAEFADELFQRLVQELAAEHEERPRSRTPGIPSWSRTGLLAAAALAAFGLALWLLVAVFTKTSPAPRPANPVPTPTVEQLQGRSIIPVGSRPTSPQIGFGSLWVVDYDGAKGVVEGADDDTDFREGHVQRFAEVTRIELATNRVLARIRGTGASYLAVGDDAVWVDDELGKAVSRIDPDTNRVVTTIDLDFKPAQMAAGFGSIWVVGYPEIEGKSQLARIDPATNAVIAQIPLGTFALNVAVGEGSVWVTDTGTGKLLRIDPSSDRVVASAELGKDAGAVAAGEGAVWVADPTANLVLRFDPKSLRVVARIAIPEPNGDQGGIAVGGGRVWYATHDGYSMISIHPEDNRVDGRVVGAAGPSGVVIGDGAIWVTNFDRGTITRIDQ
jgi:virginiamycin B lyase